MTTPVQLPQGPMVGGAAEAGIAEVGTYVSSWRDFWRRFVQNRMALVALVGLVLLVLIALGADLIAPYKYTQIVEQTSVSPSAKHLFGTDQIGRDIFSRVVYGTRISLLVGVLATTISVVIGIIAGAVSGFFGGWVDIVISRIVEVGLSIPYIVLAVSIAAIMGRSERSVIIILGLIGWLFISRIVRASFIQLKAQEFVEAATALGLSKGRIMFRHILPNAAQPIIVYAALSVGSAILAEAALSFLGAGPVDPTPSWGLMVSTAKGRLKSAPYELGFPAAAIVITVLVFLLIGDGLRDALDPKLKGR